MNLQFWKWQKLSEKRIGGSHTAKDASSWAMLLGILGIGLGRHTIAIIQIDKMDTTTLDPMDAKDIITERRNSYA